MKVGLDSRVRGDDGVSKHESITKWEVYVPWTGRQFRERTWRFYRLASGGGQFISVCLPQ